MLKQIVFQHRNIGLQAYENSHDNNIIKAVNLLSLEEIKNNLVNIVMKIYKLKKNNTQEIGGNLDFVRMLATFLNGRG